MHFTRLEHFTFWYFHRPQSYTSTHRKRMASDRTIYLAHLSRWLNYEDELTFSPLANDLNASQSVDVKGFVATEKALELGLRNRVDSFVNIERSNAVLVTAERHTLKVSAELKQVGITCKVFVDECVLPIALAWTK